MRKTLTNPNFISLLRSYGSFIKVRNYKIGKRDNYQSAVSEFLIWLEVSGISKIKEVTSKESVAYFEHLITRPKVKGEGTLAEKTIKFHLFALGLFQLNLLDNHEIENTFYIPSYSQTNQKDRNILTVEQVKTVYQYCENHQERALLSVAYGCGLRRSEIEALDIKDIQILSGMLIVRSGKNSKRREVPMSNLVMEYIRQYLTQERYNLPMGDGALFVNTKAERISGDQLNTILKKMIEQTGQYELIKSDITLHCLRHSIASHLADNNASIEFIRRFFRPCRNKHHVLIRHQEQEAKTHNYILTTNTMTTNIESYLKQSYTEQTASGYLFTINHFLKTNPKAKRYKYHNIVSYMEEVSQKQSNIQYRIRILSAIKKYYDYLVMVGQRSDHPCKRLTIKKTNQQSVQVQDLFSSEELQLLLTRENRYQHLDTRNSVLLSLLIYQGLTSEELTRLEVKDIDMDNGTIYIKASTNQNRRTLELKTKQMLLFSKYIGEVRPVLVKCTTDKLLLGKLGKPILVDSIHAIIEPLKALFPDRSLNPRTIRMSVICNWLNEKKIPLERVQELAGHKWPSTTEKYIKVNNENEIALINRFFPLDF